MVGLCSNVHLAGLLLDDSRVHRASRTNRGDPEVKITQLDFPLADGAR